MRLPLAQRTWWTWRRAVVGAAALAVVVGGGLGATMLAGQAIAAPAPAKLTAAPGDNEEQTRKGWLGITIAQLNDQLASRLGLSQTTGVVVMGVMKGSPAETAGVLKNDILKKVGDKDITDVAGAREAIGSVAPGAQVTITVLRTSSGSTQTLTLTVTAGEAPRPPRAVPPAPPRPGKALPGMGHLLPPVKELEGIPPQELFSHLQGGAFTFTDKNGAPVTMTVTMGTVSAVDTTASTVTYTPNAGGAAITVTVGPETVIRGRARELVQLKAGDRIVVTTVNNNTTARMIVGVGMPEPPRTQQHRPQRFEWPGPAQGRGPGPMAGAALMALPQVFEALPEPLHFLWAYPGEFNEDLAEMYSS